METHRDNFTAETIRRAASRVGYRCSFPGCRNATVGPSMDSSRKVSITGVAAHICAAAEGGPRYDSNMTVDQRRDIENCIWLCQTHSKLIDTDVKTYTVDTLRQWKKEAENRAAISLANSDYLSEYYKANENNLTILEELFASMVCDGQFSELNTLLSQYKTTLNNLYDELIYRYRIIYNLYCQHSALEESITLYCSLSYKSGINDLIEILISFDMIEPLKKLLPFCEDDTLKRYAQMTIEGSFHTIIIVSKEQAAKQTRVPDKYLTMVQKHVSSFIFTNQLLEIKDLAGQHYNLYREEFYYKIISAVHSLFLQYTQESTATKSIVSSENFLYIQDNLSKIKILDYHLQEAIWVQLLSILSCTKNEFSKLYAQCPIPLKSLFSIQRVWYFSQIRFEPKSVEVGNLLQFAYDSNNFDVLAFYLQTIGKESALEFLDDHKFLYKKSIQIIEVRAFYFESSADIKILDFLNQYNEIYQESMTYHCLLARYAESAEQQDKELDWIKCHKNLLTINDTLKYAWILADRKMWDELVELTSHSLPNDIIFSIACYLSESNSTHIQQKTLNIFKELLRIRYVRKGLYYNIAAIQNSLGHIEDAKENFKKEYAFSHMENALISLMQLRYNTSEFTDDDLFSEFKKIAQKEAQNLVGAIYFKKSNYGEAKKYFLRSLLIEFKDNPSISGLYQSIEYLPKETIDRVKENSVCVLHNNASTIKVAILNYEAIKDILLPDEFAGCIPFSNENAEILSLLYCEKGDTVKFKGERYVIKNIVSLDEVISTEFFKVMCGKEGTKVINFSNIKQGMAELQKQLSTSTIERNNILDLYNQEQIKRPLTVLARSLGQSNLMTYEFLMSHNRSKIISNPSSDLHQSSSIVFVLSYETIITLAYLGLTIDDFKQMNLKCTAQVKNKLIDEIEDERRELSNDNAVGSMICHEDKPMFIERTRSIRNQRNAFLIQLKSLAEHIPEAKVSYPITHKSDSYYDQLIDALLKEKLYCEADSLNAAKNIPNSVLVTDQQFLYLIANADKISNIGVGAFLGCTQLTWQELLSASQKLQELNHSNYLPFNLYRQMVDQLLSDKDAIEQGSAKIQDWIEDEKAPELESIHDDIVLELFRTVHSQNLQYLNPDDFLGRATIRIWEKRNPGIIEEYAKKMLNSLHMPIDSDDTSKNILD